MLAICTIAAAAVGRVGWRLHHNHQQEHKLGRNAWQQHVHLHNAHNASIPMGAPPAAVCAVRTAVATAPSVLVPHTHFVRLDALYAPVSFHCCYCCSSRCVLGLPP